MTAKLRLATRGSRLALWQTDHVIGLLRELRPSLKVEVVEVPTRGDIIQDVPLSKVGSSAFFTSEIEKALLEGRADVAVHSLKDLASGDSAGLRIGAVLEREDPRDALISRDGASLDELREGSRVGTSSVRRQAMLRAARPDLAVMELRGNVPTRVGRLDEGRYDAIILAAAGLKRLGLGARISQFLDRETFLPPAGQGAVAVQVRADDEETCALASLLEDGDTRVCVDAERAFLSRLGVGCQAPVGVHATLRGATLRVRAAVLSVDGVSRIEGTREGPSREAFDIGVRLADAIASRGGADLLRLESAPEPGK